MLNRLMNRLGIRRTGRPYIAIEETSPTAFSSILGGASVTNKADESANDDSFAIIENCQQQFNAMIVADGIGGLRYGGEAAHIAVQTAKELLESGAVIDIQDLFHQIPARLYDAAVKLGKKDELDQFGTTLLIGFETKDRFVVAYLGNGSIWHIAGNFASCNRMRFVPWCAVNLLNPHSVEREGREVLTKFINPVTITEPSIIHVHKNQAEGDLLLLSTDGLSSMDQTQLGQDADGNYWLRAETWLRPFLTGVSDFLGEPNHTNASSVVDKYLSDLKKKSLLDDDTTLVFSITPEAVAHATTGTKNAPN